MTDPKSQPPRKPGTGATGKHKAVVPKPATSDTSATARYKAVLPKPKAGATGRYKAVVPKPELEPVTASEVRTKLELARQFLDMGDPESAQIGRASCRERE